MRESRMMLRRNGRQQLGRRVGAMAAALAAVLAVRHFYPELHRYLRMSRM